MVGTVAVPLVNSHKEIGEVKLERKQDKANCASDRRKIAKNKGVSKPTQKLAHI